MIVFDLVCSHGAHVFEGWFASTGAFESQQAAGLLACPVCGDGAVSKGVMAPNVAAKGNRMHGSVARPEADREPEPSRETGDADRRSGNSEPPVSLQNVPDITPQMVAMIGKLAKAQSKMLEGSKWVGRDFARKARDIHYGDAGAELIHGQTSEEEAQDLIDEGISVAPLPLPVVPPEAKN